MAHRSELESHFCGPSQPNLIILVLNVRSIKFICWINLLCKKLFILITIRSSETETIRHVGGYSLVTLLPPTFYFRFVVPTPASAQFCFAYTHVSSISSNYTITSTIHTIRHHLHDNDKHTLHITFQTRCIRSLNARYYRPWALH